MLNTFRAVELARGDKDSALCKPIDGVSARLVASGPQVQASFGIVDSKPCLAESRGKNLTTVPVNLPLELLKAVILLRGDSGGLNRLGNHESSVLADGQQLVDEFLVAR